MKSINTIHLAGGTFTLAMTLAVASVCQLSWADDMTQPVASVASSESSEVKLQAIFMDVQGKVRWRINEDSPWIEAKVNDLLEVGAEIRTGLKSRAGLRVGQNATILVDAGTTFQLPVILQIGEQFQEGSVLRTVATVKSGRADFKVDHVGFANDFKVVTPQTTLSVRGTGFNLDSGQLMGMALSGASTNTINAIEVTYVAANMSYFVSGQGKTSSEPGKQDPVQNAWVSTIGPPPIAGTMVSQSDVQQQVAQGIAGANPSSNIQQIQQTEAGEANENAIDTALVLASETGNGGGDSGSGYSLFQSVAQSTEQGLSLLNSDAQSNKSLSNTDLQRFNNNFAVYENGQWTTSLRTLNTVWNGSDSAGRDGKFTYGLTSDIGARAMLDDLKNSSIADLLTSDDTLNLISFDASRYFNNEDSSDAKDNFGNAVISDTAFKDGELLNGATDSLWSLSESARTKLGIAVGLDSSVQTAFKNVKDSYGRLQVAQQALDGLSTGSAFSEGYTTAFTNQFAKLNGFLTNLQNLIGTSTSAQSKEAYAQLAGVVNSAAVHVQLGLAAAQTARENYNNASSRATQELFQAEELKYLDAVRIRLDSIAYLTKERKNADGSAAPDGPDGIKELAEQIMQNFNGANNQFAWGSFSDFARPHVVAAGIDSGAIQALASLSQLDSKSAEEQIEEGSVNRGKIDLQVDILTQQVNLMSNKTYGEDSGSRSSQISMFQFESLSDGHLADSNAHKSAFDILMSNNASQSELQNDLGALRDLNDIYTGSNSLQLQAETTLTQIIDHHDSATDAKNKIDQLTTNYNTFLNDAQAKAAQANALNLDRFSQSTQTANRYLQDFIAIKGANTTASAQNALTAITALVGQHNAYVAQAQTAVLDAQSASVAAGTRGQMVFMNAVATQISRAADIRIDANLSMLKIATNGSAIRENYNDAKNDYDAVSPPTN